MKSAGVTLLNQSVLLKQVNDECRYLLFNYLNKLYSNQAYCPTICIYLDRARGTHHFYVAKSQAESIPCRNETTTTGLSSPQTGAGRSLDMPAKTIKCSRIRPYKYFSLVT